MPENTVTPPVGSRTYRLVALLVCIGAMPHRLWNSMFSLADWAGWVVQFCVFGAALYLLWREQAARKYILFWVVVAVAVVAVFGWLSPRL